MGIVTLAEPHACAPYGVGPDEKETVAVSDWKRYCEPTCWHPAAAAFPLISGVELEELAADIKAKGLLNPVVLLEGKVLDGRNRLLACAAASVEPHFVEWHGKGTTPTAWVVSQNLTRRHLSKGQLAACAVEVLPLLEAEARERQGTRTDIGEIIPESKGRARDNAARLFNVNGRYVSSAKTLSKDAPDLFAAVKTGKLNIAQAMGYLRRRRRQAREEQVRKKMAAGLPSPSPNDREIKKARQTVERLRSEYEAAEAEEERRTRARLRPLQEAVEDARDLLSSLDRSPGVFVEEQQPGEELAPLTKVELRDHVVPIVARSAWSGIGHEAARSYGRVSFRADCRDLGIVSISTWVVGPSRPSEEHLPWAVEFYREDGTYVRRGFWYPSKWKVPTPRSAPPLCEFMPQVE